MLAHCLPSQLVKKYERGDLPKSDWLDNAAFRKMEEIHAVSLLRSSANANAQRVLKAESEKSENLYLYVDLPRFDFPVIFSESVSVVFLNAVYLTFNFL
jgi:phosphatidylinositol 3-kinase